MIELLTDSRLSSVQDLGRSGGMHLGVGRAGAMDTLALRVGNWLVGGQGDEAAIEIAQYPLRLRFHAACRYALTGALGNVRLDGRGVPPWWTAVAAPGQTLSIDAPSVGARSYLCLEGGLSLPQVLGARATDMKSGFGGLNGMGLPRGATLPHPGTGLKDRREFGVAPAFIGDFYHSLAAQDVWLRVMPASEFSALTADAQALFFSEAWAVTGNANRIGYRLEGEALGFTHMPELLSHGIVPGVIQLPGAGQPIVQLADANTCGGYPKLAVVIGCDLWKLGQLRPGDRLRFTPVDHRHAWIAQDEQELALQGLRQRIAADRAAQNIK
ncbi:biotin-dependent carboxyltransferase family protein [Bordetella genomosp. 12]|uniref:5-oxoprolinase subunit C family protein n=1 Tax=Bordetella genomosp. 12 TaxID=463035 RepID=UPI00142E0AA5|nr:biotin-dependent carboxyltransferase family protein [Bordetella genomosp. 12]